jgi:hypothetical protein
MHAVWQAPELDDFDGERHEAVERTVQGRLVHLGRQHSVGAIGFDTEVTERLTADLPEAADDGDQVAVGAHRPSTWTYVAGAGPVDAGGS